MLVAAIALFYIAFIQLRNSRYAFTLLFAGMGLVFTSEATRQYANDASHLISMVATADKYTVIECFDRVILASNWSGIGLMSLAPVVGMMLWGQRFAAVRAERRVRTGHSHVSAALLARSYYTRDAADGMSGVQIFGSIQPAEGAVRVSDALKSGS